MNGLRHRSRPKIKAEVVARDSSNKNSRGSSKTRRRRRKALFERDPHECFRCGDKGNKKNPLTVEHVIPLARGGSRLIDNLRIFCWNCNMAKAASIWFGIYTIEFFAEMEGQNA